jgi:hypothetical protein
MLKESTKRTIAYTYVPLFSLLLYISLEVQNTHEALHGLPVYVISAVLIFLMVIVVFSLTGNVFISGIIVSAILVLLYTANFYRYMQTGQVLIPSDLNLARHIVSMASFSIISFNWKPVLSVVCIAVLNIPLFYVSRHVHFGLRTRIVVIAASGLLVSFVFYTEAAESVVINSFNAMSTQEIDYNDVYETQGALLGFCSIGVIGGSIEMPENYSLEYMESLQEILVENVSVKAGRTTYTEACCSVYGETSMDIGGRAGRTAYGEAVKPNVIVVMSEAFWDPARLPNVAYSCDPVPNLHRLQNAATYGNVVTPTFGGMTCNTEFEFLTGNSMAFTGFGDIPYYDSGIYIDNDNGRSLPGMFKANGYHTVALHTYLPSFFSRESNYPELGFNDFISEDDMPDASFKGSLNGQDIISDEYFCSKLIEIVENTTEPLFLFGITMQNHVPYLPDKYDQTYIQADAAGVLSVEETAALETYLEGVYDADAVLGRLYEYVMETDTPTILLYFGDHLPAISMQTGVYYDLGYIEESELGDLSADDAYKLYTTPYISFCNYCRLPSSWGDVSPYFLGALLAEASGVRMNYYYEFLLQACSSYQAMNCGLFVSGGKVYSRPDYSNEQLRMFEAFQYDRLFGERYADELLSSIP